MAFWNWLLWSLVGIGGVAALYGLDRLGLWLEQRGWLYYRKKRPSSSPMNAWVAMHQFIEPGVTHVVQARQKRRSKSEEGDAKAWLLATLSALLEANPVNAEEIRRCLTLAKGEGMDWRKLYEEAARIHQACQPDRSDLVPPLEAVTPLGEDAS